jgi:hypothetical protein
MATVRITRDIRHAIQRNVSSMFEKPIQEAKDRIRSQGDLVYSHLIPPEIQQHMAKIPASYFEQDQSTSVYLKLNGVKEENWTVRFSETKLLPKIFSPYGLLPLRTFDLEDPKNIALKDAFEGPLREYTAIVDRQKVLYEQVTRIMDNNGTVGMCIKAWPQFYEILPNSIKQRHDEVVEKTKKETTVLDDETIAAMNTSLMVGKLAGG